MSKPKPRLCNLCLRQLVLCVYGTSLLHPATKNQLLSYGGKMGNLGLA